MRITMLSVGSTGDVRPYVLLGRELQCRGHKVTITAFSRFRNLITEAGLEFYPIHGDAEAMMSSIMEPDTSGLTYLPRLWKGIRQIAPRMITDMSGSCQNADAMICNYFGTVYYSIAEKFNIPCIQTHFFPMDPTVSVPMSSIRNQHLGSFLNKSSYKAGYLLIGSVEKLLLNDWRRDNNLTERKALSHPDYRIGLHKVPVIYAISPSLFPRPADWSKDVHMCGFIFDESPVEYEPPQELADFLLSGDRPVYIGFGSMNTGNMSGLLSIILRSIHAAGIRAVFSTGWSGKSYKSNRSVFFTDNIPHDWLFPRVSAVVHHGGAGTTAAGLRYGKPTLVIPFAGDQSFWGNQVYRSGCGPKPVPRNSVTVRKLTKSLIELKSRSDYYTSAREMGIRLSGEHGVLNAADLIELEISRW